MGPMIFVVDDTAAFRRLTERLLHAEGYHTRSASNGQEALDALGSFTPDLMLLDLSMSLMDGFELLKRLRDTPSLATLPVIVLTAETSPDTEARARALGAREVLRKSDFSPDKLLSCIRAANCRPEGRNKTTKEPQCHP
jgi:CheY-like chemotaxis protein